MHIPNEIKQRVNERIERDIEVAEKHFGIKIKFPNVVYKKRGTVAGVAKHYMWEIDLNPVLLMENLDEMINDTVPHELAHLIDYQLHPENFASGRITMTRSGRYRREKRSVHGPTWKNIMIVLGVDPSRTHNMDTTNSRVKKGPKHVYVCKTCGTVMELGDKRHAKMQAGAKYWMRGCGRHEGYEYQGRELPERTAPKPKTAPAPKERPKHLAPKAGSKLAECKKMYFRYYGISRSEMIEEFIAQAGCTPAGAATYYAKLKKELG